MNWNNAVKKILGYFWLQIWKDSWLVQLIVNLYQKLVGENFYKQLESIAIQTKCTSLLEPDTIRYVRLLVDSSCTANVISLGQDVYINELQIGGTGDRYTYVPVKKLTAPVLIQRSVSDSSFQLFPEKDFIYNESDNTIEFKKQLTQYGLSASLANTQKGLKNCFQLWAVYHDNKALRDSFTEQMGLPVEWLYKYPGAVQAAWSIKQNGANKRDVIRLLGAVGECPFSRTSGYVNVLSDSSVQIGGTIYKGKGRRLVHQGAFVDQDCKLFTGEDAETDIEAFPAVLNYKDGFPTWLKGIHVLTEVGVLFAQNSNKVPVQNVLPLVQLDNINNPSAMNVLSQPYINLCLQLNQDTKVPYAQLPSPVNPASFIFKTVWGPSASLIVVPPYNLKDMKKAVKFIVENTVLGAITLAYVYDLQKSIVLYPDAKVQDQIITYYKESVSNGTLFKERLGDFEE